MPKSGTNIRSLAVPTIHGRGLGMALEGSDLPIPGAGRKVLNRRNPVITMCRSEGRLFHPLQTLGASGCR